MKKALSICLCLILIILNIPSVSASFDMDMGEYEDSCIEYTIPELDGKYKTQGRTTIIDDVLMIDHSASGIEFSAKCKGDVAITFEASNLVSGDEGGCYFTVIVDGVEQSRELCHITEQGETGVMLANDLRYGEHTFKLYRQTEIGAEVGIKSIRMDGRLLDAAAENELYIEFVGDSITTAVGNIVLNADVAASAASNPLYQDATKGYAYLTAQALGADFSLVAQAGIGASVGGLNYTMQDMYTKLRYVNDKTTDYSFERQPDIVVIALGTNDMDTYSANGLTTDDVKQGFANMLSLVKEKNPNAAIVWVYNMMRSDGNDLITSVIEEAGGSEKGFYALKLTQNTAGGNSHPYYTAHKTMAEELTAFINENIFWNHRTVDFAKFLGNSIRAKSEKGEQGLRFRYMINSSDNDLYESIENSAYKIAEIGVLAIRTKYLKGAELIAGVKYGTKKPSAGVLYNAEHDYSIISDEGVGSAVLINIGVGSQTGAIDFSAYSDDYTTRCYMVLENGDNSTVIYNGAETACIFELMQAVIKEYDANPPTEENQLYYDYRAVSGFLDSDITDKNNKTINTLYSGYQIPAKTWVANELSFTSSKAYTDTVYNTSMDVEFFNQDTGTSFSIPAFWNGGKEWKVRFALPEAGDWRYVTKCSDNANSGLYYNTGSVMCSDIADDDDTYPDIYKHGFLTTQEGKKYLTYADGTPFFYLGDTHWTLPMESLTDGNGSKYVDTESGEKEYRALTDDEISALKDEYAGYDSIDELGEVPQFKFIMNYRAKQGFTVIQSQQLNEYNGDRSGTGYRYAGNSWMADEDGNLYSRGVDSAMLDKFNTLDKYFEYIAELGFVHAHTQFSYPEELFWEYFHYENINDEELEKLCRYWVARYSAYPVIWTTAQEADEDYYNYHTPNGRTADAQCSTCNVDSNPWEIVMDMIAEYDPYNHPTTAHMESTIDATGSAFDDSENHDFYAAQITKINDICEIPDDSFDVIRTYFENAASKPSIFYEGHYDQYQSDSLKSRAQGWMAFLNGMYGYGYGVQPIWNFYWAEHIVPQDYSSYRDADMNWVDGVYAKGAEGLSQMKNFFTVTLKQDYGADWWDILPCFNGNSYYEPDADSKYSVATIDKDGNGVMDVYIGYFAGTEKQNLGTFKGMQNGSYVYKWYDCRTGKVMATYNINVSNGQHVVASGGTLNEWMGTSWPKPSAENAVSDDENYNDMILVATKAS